MKKIAIQGDSGSFHHVAATTWYDTTIEIVPCQSFKSTFQVLQDGTADAAVVAIENSLHGSINEVYDLLLAYKYPIVGEVIERIHQCLIGFPNTAIANIDAVYSHPVALSQCSEYLDTVLSGAKRYEYYDTAASVEFIKKHGQPNHAAIASNLAAKLHGMNVLQQDVQNADTNFTRFLIIDQETPTDATNKASLVVETSHTPGSLHDVLGIFKRHNVNITKLQSRPSKRSVWNYMFYIDIESDKNTTMKLVTLLTNAKCSVTLLGTYRSSIKPVDV